MHKDSLRQVQHNGIKAMRWVALRVPSLMVVMYLAQPGSVLFVGRRGKGRVCVGGNNYVGGCVG
jgi:hypothetical protein